jgi:Ca-activated chloride channel homolog
LKFLSTSFLILFASGAAHATTVDSYLLNSDGIDKLQAKSYYPAFQDFIKALQEDPLNPQLHMNLGLALELNEEFEKAEQAYKGALRLIPASDPSRRFQTLFNLAGVQSRNKKIDEALKTYQAALEIDPDSKEVKTNIELLWQGGGGDGEGEGQEQKEGDGEGKGRPKDPGEQPQGGQEQKKKQPKPFNSQNLTPQDVKKILDEIKNQEQGIRAQEYDKGAKEAPRGKDW